MVRITIDISCPVQTTLAVIGGKWKAVILYHLRSGPKRFGALRKDIPQITQKMLTQQLRDLEAHGIVEREVYAEAPPRVEYTLTDYGRSLEPILDAMCHWGQNYRQNQL